MPDAHGNFAVSAVATAPSPASSGTSLVITAGEGNSRFAVASPYNAVVCPASTDPTPANAEVVRVTARSTDTFTITRAQEGSSARTILVGDRFYVALTAKALTDIEALIIDASTSAKGVSKLSTAPASASNPIAVGDNDPRIGATIQSGAATYRPGRTWATDFQNQEYDEALFDFTASQWTRGNDPGGRPSVRQTNSGTLANILTKTDDIADVDVRLKYRPATDAATSTTDYSPTLLARYLGANNKWALSTNHAIGNPNVHADVACRAVTQSTAAVVIAASPLSTTVDRWIRVQVISDLIRCKTWADGTDEPDWQRGERVRPASGGTVVAETAQDNTDIGKAGVTGQFTGGYLLELQVTELLRVDENLLYNSDFSIIDNKETGSPPAWWISLAGGNYTRELIADRFGRTRLAVKLAKPASGETWIEQDLWNPTIAGRNAFQTGRMRPHPQFIVPAAVEISVWTKGVSITNVGGSGEAAGFIVYYYDQDGTVLQVGETPEDNHPVLGPNAGGEGTWNWYETRVRMHFGKFERCNKVRIQVGFHDDTARGTLYILDPWFRPVQ